MSDEKMHCDEARQLMLEALEGFLPDDKVRRLEAHLAECDPCAEEHATVGDGIAGVMSALQDLAGEAPSRDFSDFARPRRPILRLAGQVALAASLLVAVGAYLWVNVYENTRPGGKTANTPVPVYITAANEGGPPRYQLVVPTNADFTPRQWQELRTAASRLVRADGPRRTNSGDFRRMPLVPVVPVSDR